MPTKSPASTSRTIPLLVILAVARCASAQPAAPADAQPHATRPTDDEIKSLVAQLSDDDFKQRNKAQAELVALGERAEPQLLERLKQDPDPEARTLIDAVLKSIARSREVAPALITLRLDGAPPGKAFTAIAEQSGIALAPGTDSLLGAITNKRVTVELDRTPMWESLLRVGAQSGIAFNSIDAHGQLVIEALPAGGAVAAPPAAAAGPFLVTIHHIETNLSKSVAFAGKRPANARQNQFNNPPCRLFFFAWGEPRLKPIRWFIDSIDECVTDTGHDMRNATSTPAWRGASSGGVNDPNETMFTLAAPDAKATHIARLSMTARFVLQKRTHTLEIPDVLTVKNATHFLGGFRTVIKDVNKVTEGRYAYSLAVYRDNRNQADWDLQRALLNRYRCRLVDAEGNELQMTGGGGGSGPNEITQNSTLTTDGRNGVAVGEPVKLVWEFPEEIQQVTVPLLFRDVPLP